MKFLSRSLLSSVCTVSDAGQAVADAYFYQKNEREFSGSTVSRLVKEGLNQRDK